MKKINELKANINEVEICEMPEVKLIGKEIRCGGILGNRAPELWDICIKDGSLEVIKALPSIIPNALLGWSGNYTEEDKSLIPQHCLELQEKLSFIRSNIERLYHMELSIDIAF